MRSVSPVHRFLLTVSMAVVPCAAGPPVSAEPPAATTDELPRHGISLVRVGQAGGASFAVAVNGDRAYLGVGPRLWVLDVSDPIHPQAVGMTEVLSGVVRAVAAGEDYAYVATILGDMHVVDVRDPRHPRTVGRFVPPQWVYGTVPFDAQGIATAGGYAYVAAGMQGLWVIDVRNPAWPQKAGTVDIENYAFDVAIEGPYAYLAVGGTALRVVDVGDPTRPRLLHWLCG